MSTHSWLFHVVAGDSNGDARVDFGDFSDLANWFGTLGGPVYGAGDMNGDGNVDLGDFSILASQFSKIVVPPTLDYGDAPEIGTALSTTLANNGARHVVGSGLFLGAGVDWSAGHNRRWRWRGRRWSDVCRAARRWQRHHDR